MKQRLLLPVEMMIHDTLIFSAIIAQISPLLERLASKQLQIETLMTVSCRALTRTNHSTKSFFLTPNLQYMSKYKQFLKFSDSDATIPPTCFLRHL